MKIKNPKLTVTVINTKLEPWFGNLILMLDDNNRLIFTGREISAGETEVVEEIIGNEEDVFVSSPNYYGDATDLVNCTHDINQFTITDPTKDASATITISGDD